MLVHLLRVEICDKKADVISLTTKSPLSVSLKTESLSLSLTGLATHLALADVYQMVLFCTYFDWLSPEDEEMFGSHHHETHELLTQDLLNLISLMKRSESY